MAIQQTFDFLDTPSGEFESMKVDSQQWTVARKKEDHPTLTVNDRLATVNCSVAGKEPDRTSVLRELRAKVGCVSTAADDEVVETLSTGSDAIDGLLPRKMLPRSARRGDCDSRDLGSCSR